jgi:hypothetical protein
LQLEGCHLPVIAKSYQLLAAATLGLSGLFFGGCATKPPVISLPYEMPATSMGSNVASASGAEIDIVQDTRADRSLDMFLSERPSDLLRRALAAELISTGVFPTVAPEASASSPSRFIIEVNLCDVSWAVPNHDRMVKTAFWTSFLTGGIGGIAYGSTDTPVYGHAVVSLKLWDRVNGKVLLEQTFDATHEEHKAKLACDTLQTRAQVMALALKDVLNKAAKSFPKTAVVADSHQ